MEEEKIWQAVLDMLDILEIDDVELAEDIHALITLQPLFHPQNDKEKLAIKLLLMCKTYGSDSENGRKSL